MLGFQRLMHLFYWSLFFTLVHLLDFVVKARIFLSIFFFDRQKDNDNDDLPLNKRKPNLTLPLHIAFHLDDQRYANEEFVCSLARHCAKTGIGRLTLSDTSSLLTTAARAHVQNSAVEKSVICDGTNCDDNAFKLAALTKQMTNEQQNGDVIADSPAVVVRRLANDEGRAAVVRACKKFSMSQLPVTPEQLDAVLTNYGEQPDFFVRVGGPFWQSAILTAHTPLAIRTTEFYCVDGFLSDRTLSDREFNALLDQFSARSRRFGR